MLKMTLFLTKSTGKYQKMFYSYKSGRRITHNCDKCASSELGIIS